MLPQSRSRTKLVLFTLLFIIVLSASGFTALFLSDAVTDAAPVQDWDLISPYAAAPDAENGYVDLSAGEALTRNWLYERLQQVMRLNEAKELDLAAAWAALAAGRDLLELFRRCVSKPRFQAPLSEVPSLYELRSVAELASLHAAVLHVEAKDEEAFDLALDIVHLGHRLHLDARDYLTYIIGSCIQGIGYQRVHSLIRDCALPPAALLHYVEELSESSRVIPLFTECQRREYTDRAGTIDRVAAGRESPQSLSPRVSPAVFQIPALSRLFLKPNLTKDMLVGYYRRVIANAGKPLAGMSLREDGVAAELRTWNASNFVGNDFASCHLHSKMAFVSLCFDQVMADGTRLLLALRAFLAEKGHLPDTLGELVPEFIDAVPLDPYDGQPLRYCPDSGTFYSVGEDLIDGGGGKRPEYGPEPTFFVGALGAPGGG